MATGLVRLPTRRHARMMFAMKTIHLMSLCLIFTSVLIAAGCQSDPATDSSSTVRAEPHQQDVTPNPQRRDEPFTWTTPFTATGDAFVTASQATGDAVVGFFTGEWLEDEPKVEEQRTLGETPSTPKQDDATEPQAEQATDETDPQPALTTEQLARGPIQYRRETRSNPRPMVLHLVEVDLTDPRVEIVSAVSDDPDGSGPADAVLLPPGELAAANDLEVAVNANAFWPLPNADGTTDRIWFTGRPIDVMGLAVDDQGQRSSGRAGFDTIWIDDAGKLHLAMSGESVDPEATTMAVSGFGALLRDGDIVSSSDSTAITPQLAVGFDADSTKLVMVMIEGRQPLLSEGAAAIEMAQLLQSMGCRDALSLDAGSAVMLLSQEEGGYDLLNRSAVSPQQRGAYTRPVPVLLGVRTVELSQD